MSNVPSWPRLLAFTNAVEYRERNILGLDAVVWFYRGLIPWKPHCWWLHFPLLSYPHPVSECQPAGLLLRSTHFYSERKTTTDRQCTIALYCHSSAVATHSPLSNIRRWQRRVIKLCELSFYGHPAAPQWSNALKVSERATLIVIALGGPQIVDGSKMRLLGQRSSTLSSTREKSPLL